MLRFVTATYLPLLLKFILSEILNNGLLGTDIFLFSGILNLVSTYLAIFKR